MSGYRVTELLESRGDPTELEPLIRGRVSGAVGPSKSLISAPAGFPTANSEENLLWVVAPGYSTTNPLGPCHWTAEHGITLPSHGAQVIVAFDSERIPTVLWWEGNQAASGETGDLKWSARESCGSEWLGPCKGEAVSRTTYSALFAIIGTKYGAGNGTTTFNLPNGEERVVMGAGATNKLGKQGGEATVKLTEKQLAAHTHPFATPLVADAAGSGTNLFGTAGSKVTDVSASGSSGGGEAHNNLQPFTTGNLFIHI